MEMRLRKKVVVGLIVMGITFLQFCTYKKAEPEPDCSMVIDTVSFKQDIIPILTANCALTGCHTTPDAQSGLNLSASIAYSQLLNPSKGYVVAGNPLYSVMYAQITTATQIMPPTGKMDNCSINIIKIWIQQGAKNN